MDIRSLFQKPKDEELQAVIKHKILMFMPVLAYLVFYLIVFALLERMPVEQYYRPFMRIDQKIPFLKSFVIPYLAWFLWVPGVLIYLLIADEYNFRRAATVLISGMTVFLVVSAIFPTKIYLRPLVLPDDGILCRMVSLVYGKDTPTNVFPSIHVFNTVVIWYFIRNVKARLFMNRWFQAFSTVISLSICLSTVFIKQHSMVDVLGGIGMSLAMIIYMNVRENRRAASGVTARQHYNFNIWR